jgi:sugar/nucleoside kinase (ribokinase family)
MNKVFIAGGVSFDRIVQLEEFPSQEPQTIFSSSYREIVGSTGGGKALNLSRLGFDVTLHTTIGQDEPGVKIRKYMSKQPIKMIYSEDTKGTETHFNIMNSAGQRISIYTTYATFDPIIDCSVLKTEIEESDFIVLNIINYVRKLIPIAKKAKKMIWCDLHDYDGKNDHHNDFIEGADFIFMSSEKMPTYKQYMKELINRGKELVVCTHGKDGASAITKKGEEINTGIIRSYEVKDTNGAGDSFFSGFLYGFHNGFDTENCMKFGTIVAGLCISSEELFHKDLSVDYVKKEYQKKYESNKKFNLT